MKPLLDRLSRVPIVTRLLAALAVVLVVSFVVTFLVTSNFSREALRRQAESVLTSHAEQGRSVLLGDVQPVIAELQFFGERFPADLGPVDAHDPPRAGGGPGRRVPAARLHRPGHPCTRRGHHACPVRPPDRAAAHVRLHRPGTELLRAGRPHDRRGAGLRRGGTDQRPTP